MAVDLTLRLASLGGLPIFVKGLKGRVLLRKCSSTRIHVCVEAFCGAYDGNRLDFESVLT